ncbi:hypothetical protein K08M3_50580 [Vibrio alginolyticus]|uniref:Uncharacterized protein n=1 Tax=Vibrio alginolyticus TaxID=663 RepID=A0A1W6U1D1_VIBAL|nr:hypothetical protein [Vibrio alginolyticus]ARP06568.1 hypothetical protein K04M1_50450 [Vibrio alginolyticus]ARP11701.1 hypothetical protein K04M3_51320 [Vibrio alginolyticus]ARP16754.1 hypothetical protein K04M5_51020 [Vibrio alginolyticus]ARP21791.1 hypothetical protein K05K4_50890 [Vibrio alginolyticus]ARP26854.1 hypothetical protein K06K5_50540 [Vibrio alginolyticus]
MKNAVNALVLCAFSFGFFANSFVDVLLGDFDGSEVFILMSLSISIGLTLYIGKHVEKIVILRIQTKCPDGKENTQEDERQR